MNKLQKGLTALVLAGTSLLGADKTKAQKPCYPIFPFTIIRPTPIIITPTPIIIHPTPIYIRPTHPIYIEQILTPIPEPIPQQPRAPDAKPNLFEKLLGNWRAEFQHYPGGTQPNGSFRTDFLIKKQGRDFLQLNSNGTFTEKYNNQINTGFFRTEYNPTQNNQGQITFYSSLNQRITSKRGKINLFKNQLNISFPDNWNYGFKR